MVEWSIAAVLKTVETRVSGGSNPSLCAKNTEMDFFYFRVFLYTEMEKALRVGAICAKHTREKLNPKLIKKAVYGVMAVS